MSVKKGDLVYYHMIEMWGIVITDQYEEWSWSAQAHVDRADVFWCDGSVGTPQCRYLAIYPDASLKRR